MLITIYVRVPFTNDECYKIISEAISYECRVSDNKYD